MNRQEAQAARRARERAQKEAESQGTKRLSDEDLPRPAEESIKMAKEANERVINERTARLNAIADSHDEVLSDQLEEIDGDTVIKDDSDDREAAAAREEEESKAYAKQLQEEGADQDEVDTKVINGETYYLQIVNGKEKWQKLKHIREAAQKVESADEYLQTASEAARNAARLVPSQDESSRVDDEDLERTLSSAIMGNEAAIKQLASVLKARPSAVTPDVLQQIDQRLALRTELAQLESEQQDILQDPYLSKLFKMRLNELKETAPQTKLNEAYKSIGKELRSAFPEKFKQNPLQAKLERKKTLVNTPSASQRQATESEDEGEEDVSSVIEQMAKARHQSQSIKHAKH